MSTRFYLCAFVIIATLLASSSALETKDEVSPLDDSGGKPDKAKSHGERAMMADPWNDDWNDDWWSSWPTKRPTRRPTKKPAWWWKPTSSRPTSRRPTSWGN